MTFSHTTSNDAYSKDTFLATSFATKKLTCAVVASLSLTFASSAIAASTQATGKKPVSQKTTTQKTVAQKSTSKTANPTKKSTTQKTITTAVQKPVAEPAISSVQTQPTSQTVSDNNTVSTAPASDRIIAIVNDTPILQSQLKAAIAQATSQLKSQNQPIPPAQKFYPQVLDQLIMQQAQLDMIQRSGLKVDDNQVNSALMNIAKQNGFTTLSEFQQSIDAKQAGSYRALRQQVSDGLALKSLQQQQIARRVKISDQDVDLFLKSPESNALKQSSYRTLHIRVPFNTTQTAPTDKQKQQAMSIANNIAQALQASDADVNAIIAAQQANFTPQIVGGDMGFHTVKELPTDVASHIQALAVGEVSKPLLTPEGVNIIKLVDKRGDEQKIIDQWSVRHILVSPSATLSPELAKQRIDGIYEQLRKGDDFATLASTYSDDVGSASKGGSLGWASEGDMVPEFEKMMKNTAVNDFSTPFQSQFGWHILKVEGKRQQDVTDIYRRNMARELLYQRQAPQALEDWLQEIRSQAYIKVMDAQ